MLASAAVRDHLINAVGRWYENFLHSELMSACLHPFDPEVMCIEKGRGGDLRSSAEKAIFGPHML